MHISQLKKNRMYVALNWSNPNPNPDGPGLSSKSVAHAQNECNECLKK